MLIHSYDFKHQDEKRASFNRLATHVFGLNFESWYQKGAWDDRYICHSIVADGQIVSNVSVSKMDLIVSGKSKSAIQIGTVMTHPEYRGMGFSRQLMDFVMNHYKNTCDLVYLFANQTVLDFYPKFGFTAMPEHRFYLNVSDQSKDEIVLDVLNVFLEDHWKTIEQMLCSRRTVSQRFGVSNNKGIFQFYALNVLPECLYYSKSDNAIIVFEQKGEILHLYDIVSKEEIDLEALVSRIVTKMTRKIQFHFTPDQLIDETKVEPYGKKEDVLFFKPRPNIDELHPFCVPKLAHA